MSYAVVVTKVDPQTKKEAQKTAEEMGLSLSSVIKAFLKQFIRTKTITFSAYETEESKEYIDSVIRLATELKRKNTLNNLKFKKR